MARGNKVAEFFVCLHTMNGQCDARSNHRWAISHGSHVRTFSCYAEHFDNVLDLAPPNYGLMSVRPDSQLLLNHCLAMSSSWPIQASIFGVFVESFSITARAF